MRIYKLSVSDEGLTACFSKSNNVGALDFWDRYEDDINSDRPLSDWQPVNFYTDCEMNIRKLHNNILRFSMGYFVCDEQAKTLLEKEYSDILQFAPVYNEDDEENNYYLLYPYISLPALDLDRSECRFVNGKRYANIYTYVFKEDIRYKDVFKLRNHDPIKNDEWVDSRRIFVTENFIKFVRLNGITGFIFEEVYNSANQL